MKTYTVLFAVDVPHYGTVGIEASNDRHALAKARKYWENTWTGEELNPATDSDWDNAVCHRIVEITDDTGKQIAHDVALDNHFLRYGGERERLLCDAAPKLRDALQAAVQILERIAEAVHYENGLTVTALDARQIEDIYADATGQLPEFRQTLIDARFKQVLIPERGQK